MNILDLEIVEKYNPYHDPKTGRFASAPDGRAGGAYPRTGGTTKEEDKAYMDAVKSGDMATAQRMVQEKAERMGVEMFDVVETSTYKIRTDAPPTETVKAYKVFFVDADGDPSALFVEGQNKLPVGVWLDAQPAWHFEADNGHLYVPSTINPSAKKMGTNKKVNGTGTPIKIPNDEVRQELIDRGYLPEGSTRRDIIALAYRPGWHAGDLPFFPQGGAQGNPVLTNNGKPNGTYKPDKPTTNYENVHRWNQVVYEVELAANKNYTKGHVVTDKKRKATYGKYEYEDMQEMPTDGYYKYATNPMMKSDSMGAWYISGSMKINRALSQQECDDMLTANGFKVQEWESGTMSLDKLNVNPNKTDKYKKLPDAVTYDDKGNVIPLSQRMNPNVADVRKALSFADIRKSRIQKNAYDEWLEEHLDASEEEQKRMKKKLEKEEPETFNIMKADDDKREVFGWALVAVRKNGEQIVDHQKDVVDPDELEHAAYEYVLKFRDTGELHDADLRKKGKLIESVVFTKEKMRAMGIPEGTVPEGWWVGFKIDDDNAWDGIKKGRYRMFSIEGTGIRQPMDD